MSGDKVDKVSEILSAVRSRFGISFGEAHTGGGCMALEARLESGHWIVATDENLTGFRERVDAESHSDSYNAGWSIGIYEDEDGSWMGGNDSVVDVVDMDSRAENLPDVVAKALAELSGVAKRNKEAQ